MNTKIAPKTLSVFDANMVATQAADIAYTDGLDKAIEIVDKRLEMWSKQNMSTTQRSRIAELQVVKLCLIQEKERKQS